MDVAKFATELMIHLIMLHARSFPAAVPHYWRIGPMPYTRTIIQLKKLIPTVDTT